MISKDHVYADTSETNVKLVDAQDANNANVNILPTDVDLLDEQSLRLGNALVEPSVQEIKELSDLIDINSLLKEIDIEKIFGNQIAVDDDNLFLDFSDQDDASPILDDAMMSPALTVCVRSPGSDAGYASGLSSPDSELNSPGHSASHHPAMGSLPDTDVSLQLEDNSSWNCSLIDLFPEFI